MVEEVIGFRKTKFEDLMMVVLNISVDRGVVIVGAGFGGVGIRYDRHRASSLEFNTTSRR